MEKTRIHNEKKFFVLVIDFLFKSATYMRREKIKKSVSV